MRVTKLMVFWLGALFWGVVMTVASGWGSAAGVQTPERFQTRGFTTAAGNAGVLTLVDTQTGACWISWRGGLSVAPKETCE